MSDPTLPPPQPIPMSHEEQQFLLKEMLHKVKDATDTESTIRRLTAERDEALADARRYRFIRTRPRMLLHLSNKELDAAIDAAMEESSDEQA